MNFFIFIKKIINFTDPCPENRFICNNDTRCIAYIFKCDGVHHCIDGSDELNCGR